MIPNITTIHTAQPINKYFLIISQMYHFLAFSQFIDYKNRITIHIYLF